MFGRCRMDDPLAVLDPARPDGAWAREHLAGDVVGWLTTVAPDGQPQSSVVAFFWDGADIVVYSQPGARKVRNIAANPHVAFTLCGDAYGDHMLSIEGTAAADASLPPQDEVDAYVAKYREPLEHWGMDAGATAREFSLPIRLRPTRIRAF
jgi:PPOX class probable F420-dependent enzyme